MTFTELRTEVMNRLNLSSSDASTRIGSYINQRYRRLTSSLGLNTSRRTTTTVPTVDGTATVSVSLEKVELVYITASGSRRVLREIQYEDWKLKNIESQREGVPTEYAITAQGASTITLGLYPTPNAVITLSVDGLANASTLSGSDVPAFPADFHDALILGAMSDELFKMEKHPLAKDFQRQYEERVSDLRLFLAKSALLSMAETDYPGGIVTVVQRHRRP